MFTDEKLLSADFDAPTLWPDFRKPQLIEALEEYARRHRRFGGI